MVEVVGFTDTGKVIAEELFIVCSQVVLPSVYFIVYGPTKPEFIASKVKVPFSPTQIVLPVNPLDALFGSPLTVAVVVTVELTQPVVLFLLRIYIVVVLPDDTPLMLIVAGLVVVVLVAKDELVDH